MSAPLKLTIFGVALAVAFAIAFFAGGAIISPEFVEAWTGRSGSH